MRGDLEGVNQIPALRSPQVVVVEASAGSGKTYALAKRYLQLIIHPALSPEYNPLPAILAITFTNKAMIEMKERIVSFLKKIALDAFAGKDEEQELLGLLDMSKKLAQDRASRIMDTIIQHYNNFQVKTIDSFINTLLLGCALAIERSARFSIKRDYREHLSYCLDLAIEHAHQSKEVRTFLEEFLQHYLFVENRSGWFPKDDILELMHSFFTLANTYGRGFSPFKKSSAEVIAQKKIVYTKLQVLADSFPEGFNANARKFIRSFLDKNKDIFDIASLPAALQKAHPPMNKGSDEPAGFGRQWKQVRRLICELVELDAQAAYNPYLKLFNELIGFFQEVSKKEDVVFLEELNHKARLLFSREAVPLAEVYYRLATRFRHYLIDEFQDTSRLQWANLSEMVKDGLSSGGSLFYVGDKKQAIYRFRGGDAQLFDEVRGTVKPFDVALVHLTKNWRSQKEIVEFNNRVFSRENLTAALGDSGIRPELTAEDDVEDIVGIFKDAVQEAQEGNPGGYVALERIKADNQTQRNEIVRTRLLGLLGELRERFNYEDIALLARHNSEVELLTSWLLNASIAVESEKTLNVVENPYIREIISLLHFIYSVKDDLAFAGFILGDIFQAASHMNQTQVREFLFSANRSRKLEPSAGLCELFRQRFPQVFRDHLEYFLSKAQTFSVYELLIEIYRRFDILQGFADQQAFFMKFLALAKDKEEEYVGLEAFLGYLKDPPPDDLYVRVVHSSCIKVLTIHKAKGLEFPVVIIPFLRMDINPASGEKNASSYVIDMPGEDLGLIRITKHHRLHSPLLRKIYSRAYKKACIDELNSMYVALTRPQYELYIFVSQKSATEYNKAWYFMPEVVQSLGARRQYPRTPTGAAPLIEIKPARSLEWMKMLPDEFVIEEEIKNRARIEEGILLHALLSRLRTVKLPLERGALAAAFAYVKGRYPYPYDTEGLFQKVSTLLSRRELADIFSPSSEAVFCEKEIVNRRGELKRIDRLILRDREAWVIDYKLSAQSHQAYQTQVREYIQIVAEIFPKRVVRGFLLYLNTFALEEVTG